MTLLLIVAALAQDRYVLDARDSRFTAKVEVGGLLSMFGHDHLVALRDFSGDVRFDPDHPDQASLRLTIRAASIEEASRDFSEEDRKAITQEIHDKALEVSRFPEILFQSTGVSVTRKGDAEFQIVLRGTLTMHGETRRVSVPVRFRLNGDRFTADGTFQVRHSDYGIERLSAAAGTVKAKDEITLTFHLVGGTK
jgi:polyisoprenoid-binding protein YceI